MRALKARSMAELAIHGGPKILEKPLPCRLRGVFHSIDTIPEHSHLPISPIESVRLGLVNKQINEKVNKVLA